MERKKSAKEYLMESAVELLSHSDVQTISVVDIAKNAGVSTRTFYNYFQDKHELFLSIYTSELERFYREHDGRLTFRPFVLKSGQILWDHQDVFRRYQKYSGQNSFRDSAYQPLMHYYSLIITDCFHDKVTKDTHDALSFWVHGMIGYVSWSFTLAELEPYMEACEKFMRYMPDQLKRYL